MTNAFTARMAIMLIESNIEALENIDPNTLLDVSSAYYDLTGFASRIDALQCRLRRAVDKKYCEVV